jgi:hypothetical protein
MPCRGLKGAQAVERRERDGHDVRYHEIMSCIA